MINKVKPPVLLTLVQSSKQAKNDLGGQSGEAYSQSPPEKEEPPKEAPALSVVPSSPDEVASAGGAPDPDQVSDQVGLTQVMKEWLEDAKPANGISRQKMSLKYQGESAPAKGMLLNKKIS